MLTQPELTIVIPAKNEARNLPRLLISLSRQDYPLLPHTRVYVADAGSTDGTVDLAAMFADRLRISVIAGGLPAVGRNRGARLATTPYVLFIDADIEFNDDSLLRRSMDAMKRRKLHCLTTNIRCSGGAVPDHLLFAGNNLAQRLASWTQPFATGMFMLFDRERFIQLGGFNEQALYAEDYLLSKSAPFRHPQRPRTDFQPALPEDGAAENSAHVPEHRAAHVRSHLFPSRSELLDRG